jgi:sortase A
VRFAAVLRTAGELLVTAGVILLLFVVYELKITDLQTAQSQRTLRSELQHQWAAPAPVASAAAGPQLRAADPGQGLAVLRIPRFGAAYAPVVVEGVSTHDLELGPGHYPGTALPGQVGNFVVSGHRTTYGHPFTDLDQLRVGDPVVVETRDSWFTYSVTSTRVVPPTQTGVVLPVPDQPTATPTQRLLTFTTCNPKYSASTRLIVLATLTDTHPKADGLPTALAGFSQ